jgi:uncharacterized iron-regulated membrane protein
MALPVLVLLVAAGMSAVAIVGAQLRCVDSAREAARAAARGEPASVVRQLAHDAAPRGADVAVVLNADRVEVTVSAQIRVLARLIPAVRVSARAVGRQEPDAWTER